MWYRKLSGYAGLFRFCRSLFFRLYCGLSGNCNHPIRLAKALGTTTGPMAKNTCHREMLVAAVFAAVLGCSNPVPPSQGISISDDGRIDIRALLAMLQSLKVVDDVRDVSEQFQFMQSVFDTPSVKPDPLRIDTLVDRYTRGLAKGTFQMQILVDGLGSGLARSRAAANDDTLRISYDTAAAITVGADTSDTAFLVIRHLDAALLDSVWTSGYDSIHLHFSATDTARADTIVDWLVRVRSADGGKVIDRQLWTRSSGGYQLDHRGQSHSAGANTSYYHHAGLVRNASALFVVDTIGTGVSLYHMERQVTGSSWWRTLDKSKIVSYAEQVDSAGVIRLSRTVTDFDSDGVVIDFGSADTQIIAINTLRSSTARNEDTYVKQLWSPVSKILEYRSRVIKNPGTAFADTVTTRASDIVYGVTANVPGTCSLSVSVIPRGSRDSTQFGIRTASTSLYRCTFSGDLLQLMYTSLRRTDIMTGSNTGAVVWDYVPVSALPIGSTAQLNQFASIRVGAEHKTADTLTQYESWMRSGDSLHEHVWVGNKNDTMRVEMNKSGSAWTYDYDRPALIKRHGVISQLAGGVQTIEDTLRVEQLRTFRCTVDSSGRADIQVDGLLPFSVKVAPDTVRVAFADSLSSPVGATAEWIRKGQLYSASTAIPGRNRTFSIALSLDPGGVIAGSCSGTGGTSAASHGEGIQVKPYYYGKARMYGVFEGDEAASIFEDLSVTLWGSSQLTETDSFD